MSAVGCCRVELDGLSHLALEQPLILSSQFKRITRSMFRAAQFPVLCGPLIELIHTVMHTTPSDATAEVVMLLADCIDTLGHAGSNLIHFGHQVLVAAASLLIILLPATAAHCCCCCLLLVLPLIGPPCRFSVLQWSNALSKTALTCSHW
jgi:hypothetical protein